MILTRGERVAQRERCRPLQEHVGGRGLCAVTGGPGPTASVEIPEPPQAGEEEAEWDTLLHGRPVHGWAGERGRTVWTCSLSTRDAQVTSGLPFKDRRSPTGQGQSSHLPLRPGSPSMMRVATRTLRSGKESPAVPTQRRPGSREVSAEPTAGAARLSRDLHGCVQRERRERRGQPGAPPAKARGRLGEAGPATQSAVTLV